MTTPRSFDAVVVGVSAGGFDALARVLSEIPPGFSLPILVAQHRSSQGSGHLASLLDSHTRMSVKDAEENDRIMPATVYLAPPDFHLLVGSDRHLSLSVDPSIDESRPSINGLFCSAASVFRERLIGLVMTGANSDGASGLKVIQDNGGLTVIQHPDTAESKFMPLSALKRINPDHIVALPHLGGFLSQFDLRSG